MAFRQWLKLHTEAVYGTVVTPETTPIYIRLDKDNACTLLPNAMRHEFRTADAKNQPILNVSSRRSVAGSLNTLLYAEQADTILSWATTLTSDELPSMSLTQFDSQRVRQFSGVKVKRLTLAAASETEEGVVRATLDLIAQKWTAVDPTFTEPAITVFPKLPYKFIQSKGGLIVATAGTTPRTKYKSFNFTVDNDLDSSFDEDQYISDCNYQGRVMDLAVPLRYVSTTDRTNYESQAAHAASIVFTQASPAHVLTLDWKGNTYISALDRDIPLGRNAYETLHLRPMVDSTVGSMFSYTAT
jgi:hypothetical protein